jgi:tetratricopeptide (TPR) repeat protein
MDADTRKLNAQGLEVLYGRGWLLTHYLTFAKEREGQLGKYLVAINKGTPSLKAAQEAFGDLDKLDSDLDRYQRSKLAYLRVPGNKIAIAPVEVRELSPGASAMLPVMMRSRRGVSEESAKAVLRDARTAAAPYPEDPFVQLALAEAEIDAGNLAECDKAADRVLAAEPNNVRAMVFKGRIAIAKLKDAKASTPEDWKQARRWFVKANRAEPGAPEPLIQFYASFRSEGYKPTPNAVEGLRSAAALAPEDEGVGMMLGYQYLEDGKGPDARAVLSRAAFSPHGGGLAEFAGKVIAAIDSGGATAGLKAWGGKPEDTKGKAASE